MSNDNLIALLALSIFVAGTSTNGEILCLSEQNAERTKFGMPPLQNESKIQLAAQTHSELMSSTGCYAHQCPGELSLEDRVDKAGYQWSEVSENIASGFKDCKAVVAAWMNSQEHRVNMLGNYIHIGCGRRTKYWTCVYSNL